MACIKTLNKAITYDCQPGSVGIAEIYLINFDDVTAATVDASNQITALSLKSGAKTIPVEAYKNGAKLTEALKLSDVSAGLDQSIMFTLYDKTTANANLIMAALLSGRFMAAVKLNDINAAPLMVGYKCGLEISQADTDSSAAGGFTTITIKTPDDARGENRITMASAAWTTITAAKLV
ncbi:hypothetical protein BO668P2_00002 [Bacteroides phage BO668P2]|nr:hypothetical protein BO668P2_00002 [Bacteroides phage BO668P2]